MSSAKTLAFLWRTIAVCGLSASFASAGPLSDGAGKRTVGASANAKGTSKKAAAPFDHKQGSPPKQPASRLPEGAAGQPEDSTARRHVRGRSGNGGQRATDPELAALREADRVLFPRTLVGFRPGWDWGDTDPSVQADGLPPLVQALPSATMADAIDAEWLRSLAMPDFPVRLDRRVVEYLRFYRDTDRGRAIAKVWARKVGRYTGAMRAELMRTGLPQDLVWVSLIESGHDPTIFSPAGAAGLWQFIPETARMYGLTVDRWVDERLDPQRATQGAAAFLGDLYQRFGTWELAMAAYNMGHGGLLRSVRKYNTNDFWRLSEYEAALPWETTLYVPKIIAIAIVMNNLRAFGLDQIEADPAVAFDTVYVRSHMPLADVAKAAGVPVNALRSMNPQYRGEALPPSAEGEKAQGRKWPVRVPTGKGEVATTELLGGAEKQHYGTYLVRFGDTTDDVAARLNLKVERLQSLNGMRPGERLTAGAVLLVPQRAVLQEAADSEELVVVPPRRFKVPGRKRIFYRVLSGDSVAAVAHELSVTVDELIVWNDLDKGANLQGGMILQAYVPKHADLSRVRSVASKHARIFEAGTEEFLEHVESLNGRQRRLVSARSGDTLAKIGKRYGLTVGMMERINRFSRSRTLKKGEKVIVYAKDKKRQKKSEAGRPLAQAVPVDASVLPQAE